MLALVLALPTAAAAQGPMASPADDAHRGDTLDRLGEVEFLAPGPTLQRESVSPQASSVPEPEVVSEQEVAPGSQTAASWLARGPADEATLAPGPIAGPETGPVGPDPIVVDTDADELDGSPGNGDCSLREAIQTANTGSNFGGCTGAGGIITLPAGTSGTVCNCATRFRASAPNKRSHVA